MSYKMISRSVSHIPHLLTSHLRVYFLSSVIFLLRPVSKVRVVEFSRCIIEKREKEDRP